MLVDLGAAKTRAFYLSPMFLRQYEDQQPEWGFDGLGYFVFKRTYARELPDGSIEEWVDTCKRVVEGTFTVQKYHCQNLGLPWNDRKAQRSAQDMFKRMWTFKFTPPGRGLWMMGTDVILSRGSACLNNCGFSSTENIDHDFSAPFTFLMDMSMLGVGVGGDVRGVGKVKLQLPKTTERTFEVADTREGWVDLIRVVLDSFVGKGQYPEIIDFGKVRKRGEALKTLGGKSSGPGPLVQLVLDLVTLLTPGGEVTLEHSDVEDLLGPVLKTTWDSGVSREPYPITSTIIVDIFNFVGKAVVAGGIRRSSEIMFGEPGDKDFVTLKQDQTALQDRRWVSNNSIWGTVGMDYTEVAESMQVNGEPGIIWLDNVRKFGRMGRKPDHKDHRVMGANPCITGDTILFTSEGPRRTDRMLDKPFGAVVDNEQYACETGVFKTGTKPVYLVQTREGHSLRVTADHKILTAPKVTRKKRYEMWVETTDLLPGDKVVLNDVREVGSWGGKGTKAEGWLLGILLGDGHFHKGQETAKLQFWGDSKEQLLKHALECVETLGGEAPYHEMRTGTEVKDRDMVSTGSRRLWETAPEFGIDHDKNIIDDTLLLTSSEFQAEFLRGFFDADGSVQGDQRKGVSVRIGLVNRQHLSIIQKMLMNFGINSTIYWDRQEAGPNEMPDGKGGKAFYDCHALHELVISKDNILQFARRIGFAHMQRKIRLAALVEGYKRTPNRERFVATVKAVTYVGIEDVYDCTVNEAHRFGANGIVVHNCMEQSLESFELCCLVETFPAHHDDLEDYRRTLKVAYMYAKTVTLIPTHDPRTNAVMMRNRRIGCSQSGIVQAMKKLGRREYLRWCDVGYDYIQELDGIYSDWLCVPRSIKTTSVKPSGTVSLLAGSTPGIHHAHSEYYLRHVRVTNTSPLVQACRDAGYPVNDDPYATDTSVIGFPVHEENFDRPKVGVSIWEQFENAAALQRHWADNQVSCTIHFQAHERKEVKRCLEVFETQLKGISLLPLDESDHGYHFPPYASITKDEFDRIKAGVSPIDMGQSRHEVTEKFCDSDSCTI